MGKFLLWLQERIKRWIKPTTPALIIGILSDLTRSLFENKAYVGQSSTNCSFEHGNCRYD